MKQLKILTGEAEKDTAIIKALVDQRQLRTVEKLAITRIECERADDKDYDLIDRLCLSNYMNCAYIDYVKREMQLDDLTTIRGKRENESVANWERRELCWSNNRIRDTQLGTLSLRFLYQGGVSRYGKYHPHKMKLIPPIMRYDEIINDLI